MSTETLDAPEIEVIDAPKLSAVKVYNPIEQGIALMLEKHGAVLITPPDVSTAKAMAATKANRTEMVKFRTSIEAARKAEKEESLVYGRLVDSEAKRITAIAAPIEKAYDDAITAEEARLEALRLAAIEAERVRITGHKDRIQAIKDVRETANLCRTSDRLQQLIDGMPAHMEKSFEEFQDDALTAFNEVCTVLGQLLEAKVEQEKQAADLARQQADLAAQRAEQARIDQAASEQREREEAEATAKRIAEEAELQKRVDEINAREAEFQRREREAQDALEVQKRQQQESETALAAEAVAPTVHANGAPLYSTTTFKENGQPIMLNDQGTRSVFCDLNDDVEPVAAPSVEPTLKLGEISARLAPLSITADGLRTLGFEPAKSVGAAKLYQEDEFPAMVYAAIAHLGDVLEKHEAA